MGGRGSFSGSGRQTSHQQQKIRNLKKVAKKYGYEDVKTKMDKSGNVHYEYIERKRVTQVHTGKMQSPDKNDIYERVKKNSGVIMPDGLIKKNKSEYTDTLIKKGRR